MLNPDKTPALFEELACCMRVHQCSQDEALAHYTQVLYEGMRDNHDFRNKVLADMNVLEAITKVFLMS